MARIDKQNQSRYWITPSLPGLSCLHADFTTHSYPVHRHDALVVAVTEAGGSVFSSGGQTEEAKDSVLIVFNPDEPHSSEMGRSKKWRYRGFYLDITALEGLQQALGLTFMPYFERNVIFDPELIRAFLALHRDLDKDKDLRAHQERLVHCFGELARRHGSPGGRIPLVPADRTKLEAAQRLMRDRYHADLSLVEMGQEIGLTPFQLIRLFKRTTGQTPHGYLIHLRLKAAIAHMEAGDCIADAAYAAGFSDQSALTKHFKRWLGITPMQWIAAKRAAAI